jgi:hypothetical protein
MESDKPHFRCPFTLSWTLDGRVVVSVTTRAGKVMQLGVSAPSDLLAGMVIEQHEGSDTVVITYFADTLRPLYA